MLALKQARRLGHGLGIERIGIVQRVSPLEWRHDAAPKDAVMIDLGQRLPTRVKVGSDFFRREHADRWRQQGVEGAQELGGGQLRTRLEMRHLPERMHAGIGPPCGVDREIFLRQLADDVGQRPLDRRSPGLNLPAAEVGAVIGQGEFDVMHRSERRRF